MEIFDVSFFGVNSENGRKLVLTLGFIVVFLVLRYSLTAISRWLMSGRRNEQTRFWIQQSVSLILAVILIFGAVSVWFDDSVRLATVLGFISAGVAFALQKVITSIAAYFVILRSQVFQVGDRILMSACAVMLSRSVLRGRQLWKWDNPPARVPTIRKYGLRAANLRDES